MDEEISTSKISGVQDFYNLRNVNEATKEKKKEQQRMREERIKTKRLSIKKKRLRRQRKREEAKAIVDRALKLREEMYEKRVEFEASDKGKEEQEKYRSTPPWSWRPAVPITEVTNQLPAFEWVPSFSVDKFGRISVLKCTSWRVEEYTLELAECVVGLQSFTEDKHLLSCSGTIVEFLKGVGHVVTSASLVKLPHQNEIADKLKINVCLPSGEILKGSVSNVDFCYNICVVDVYSTSQLPAKRFSADTRIFNFNDCHSKDVVALARLCKRWSLNVASGKLTPRRSQFDCEELLVSSCRISKRGVGGPLMDFDGNIIGMNFYDKKETPFVPGFIVLKCLQHFSNFGMVIRPLHGLRVKTLHEEQLTVLEKIHLVFPGACGVIVEKVEVPSPEHSEITVGDSDVMVEKVEVPSPEHSEIKVGDIITHVDGIPFSSAAEFGGILLDTCGQHMLEMKKLGLLLLKDDNQMSTSISLKFEVKRLRGRKSETTTRTIKVDKFTPASGKLNRWPLGRAYLLRRVEKGTLYTEERYG